MVYRLGMGILMLWVCLWGNGAVCYGSENISIPFEGDVDYDEVQGAIDDVLGQDSFDFKEYVLEVVKGERGISFQGLWKEILGGIKKQLISDQGLMFRFLGIAIVGAVFSNFTKAFRNNHVSETGFYVTYLMLFSLISVSFYGIVDIASATIGKILEFMRAMIPAYYMAVTFSAGLGTSAVFYQGTLIVIGIVETLLIKLIIPFIKIYFVLSLVNHLSKEDLLSKAMELLETGIRWTLKTLLGLVTGYNVIQGLIVPAADNLKNKTILSAVNVIPGIGNALGSVTETVLGAGIVLKNAIGAAGICVIIILISVPILRIGIYTLLYKLGASVVQPISDKRVIGCLSGSAKASGLLLYTTFVSGILFLLTILVVMATTNGRI